MVVCVRYIRVGVGRNLGLSVSGVVGVTPDQLSHTFVRSVRARSKSLV